MGKKNSDFLKRLLATFKIEAEEHLRAISSGLLELEKMPTAERQAQVVEAVFREAHSLKGAARAVNLTNVEAVCQSLESILAVLKRQEIATSPELFDVLHQAVDHLSHLFVSLEAERTPSERSQARELLQRLERALKGNLPPPRQAELGGREGEGPLVSQSETHSPPTEERPALAEAETVRVSTAKLDAVLRQAEELLSAKLAAGQRVSELREVNATLAAWGKEWAKVHPDIGDLQQSLEKGGGQDGPASPLNGQEKMTKILGFLEWNNSCVKSLQTRLTVLTNSSEHDRRSLGGMVDSLLEDVKKASMLPFSSLLEGFPGFIRELSRDQGKQVELVIQGGDLEIDRRILEEMKDPLVHLVRNAVDHGIEKPEERRQKKNPPRGIVTLAVSQKDGDNVEVLVADDGAGIDIAKVKAAAVRLGIHSQEETERLSEQEALSLIFQSGISTSPMITDISGRGLGLAIVREKVEKLGGAVSLETHPDAGTTFRIVLPLTLATFRGVLVRAGEHLFILPTTNVERAVRVKSGEIKTVENRETIQLDGRAISAVRLGDVLELPQQSATDDSANSLQAVVLASGGQRIAFLVDDLIHEQEVLMKSLGKQLSRVRNIAGAAVLGTGEVVPVLNVPDLMKSAVRAGTAPTGWAVAHPEKKEAKRESVLVVEDSITARTLLKGILEAAGYDVTVAVDGIDGFTQLRSGEFDVVVSDVDMPRMNGFDLTAKIRSDKTLADLPVVLVTALESREDRERGVDVGANAYIVKRSFDQSNLLEVIRRLV